MLEKLKLQLFAEDDEQEELTDEIVEDEEEIQEEEQVEEAIEEEETEEMDSKTRAIIKHKKENASLKKQLAELQNKLLEQETEKQKNERILELTNEGKSVDEAKKLADKEYETLQIKHRLAVLEIERLEDKYPDITLHTNELIQDAGKLPDFTIEQIYLAKYKPKSQYDEKTRLEQEILYKTKEAREKSLEASTSTPTETVKLTASEEKAYNEIKKYMPTMTRKRFKELSMNDSLEI